MKPIKYLLVFFLTIIFILSCDNKDKPENFDYGSVKNGIYQNDYFKFKMVLPTSWIVQTKEQTENLANTGKQLIAGDDDKMKAIIKASEINIAYLLSVFQFEVGTPVDYNPSIMIVAENIKNAPGIKNGSDYLFQTRKMMLQSQFKYDYISDEFELEKIGEIEFYKLDTGINLSDMEIKQIYYATVLKGFGIGFIISFNSDEQKDVLLDSMHSLTIAK